jgi:hypothetical protein
MSFIQIKSANIPLLFVITVLLVGLAAGVALASREQASTEKTIQKRQQAATLLDTVLPPNDARKIDYHNTAIGGKQQFVGTWVTSASLLNVANHFYQTLPEQNWDIDSSPITNQNQVVGLITATKENRNLFISLERDTFTNETTIVATIPSATNAVPLSANQIITEPASPSASTKIAFVANTGSSATFTHILDLIKSEHADYVFHAGDFDLQQNPALFASIISSILGETYPYLYTPGDKDVETDLWYGDCKKEACYSNELLKKSAANDLLLEYPEVQQESSFDTYAVNLGNVHVVALGLGDLDTSNTGIGTTVYAPFITKIFSESEAPLKVCVFHETMYQAQIGNQIDSMGWQPFESCRQQGALIVTGGDHSYHRSKTILNYPEKMVSKVWNQSNMTRLEPGTSVLVNSGLGGALFSLQERCKPITPPYGCLEEWASVFSLSQEAEPGVFFVEVAAEQQTLAKAYFKTTNNQLIDSFSISLWEPGSQLTEANTNQATKVLSAIDKTQTKHQHCLQISTKSAANIQTETSHNIICNQY